MSRKQSRAEREAEFQKADPVDCVAGPVEAVDVHLGLRIPLDSGGSQLIECAGGTSRVEDDLLVVVFPAEAAAALGLTIGSQVVVGRKGSRFAVWTEAQWNAKG